MPMLAPSSPLSVMESAPPRAEWRLLPP
ncbi:hypothetical protein B566_EDAN002174 [Ephemera danica]|nr:hypothetical protein B566_EDAN002174 [Ephemera danica]